MSRHLLVFTVTNDLTYDQRMQRICTSLAVQPNYNILLIGRLLPTSVSLIEQPFQQKRLKCNFNKGFVFYIEYNIRLFFFLLFLHFDVICAIDLDTILPCYLSSILKNKPRVYDAHELFTEQKEIITRPFIHRIWKAIEAFAVPKFKCGYTVNVFIQEELKRRYGVQYDIVRNLPIKHNMVVDTELLISEHPLLISIIQQPFILYQGAVNEGRSFETLIPAMAHVSIPLIICGTGNMVDTVQNLIKTHHVEDKVIIIGALPPTLLKQLTPKAYFGLTLFEATGLNQYYSLANRFFDYIMGGIPQVCVSYPEYKAINDQMDIALLVENTSVETLSKAMNLLLKDNVLYGRLQQNTTTAKQVLNWEHESNNVIDFWRNICT